MKDKAILMTPDNIVLIHKGLKTMTRRLITPQPILEPKHHPFSDRGYDVWMHPKTGCQTSGAMKESLREFSPYHVGQRLYIKEPWAAHINWDEYRPTRIPKKAEIWFRSNPGWDDRVRGRIRSPRHMPKHFARTWLKVTEVKPPERVQDIKPQDCKAEGISGETHASPVRGNPYEKYKNGDGLVYTNPADAFKAVWDDIYGIDNPKAWDSNPWVWPIRFEEIE